jgi:hypothetical protein
MLAKFKAEALLATLLHRDPAPLYARMGWRVAHGCTTRQLAFERRSKHTVAVTTERTGAGSSK